MQNDSKKPSTGRLTGAEPRLQNIPIKTEIGTRVRAAFVEGAGHDIVAADYSGVETRIAETLKK